MKKINLSKKYLVLGATGLLGSRLKIYLEKKGLNVKGTSKEKKSSKFLYLDTNSKKSIETFPWSRYDVIIDCIGNIDYRNEPGSVEKNVLTNVIGPISIIKHLTVKQQYFYPSTHSVFLSPEKHNSYSLSKLMFEEFARKMKNGYAKATLVRIPAIFSETRNSGLLFNIKESFLKKKPLTIDFNSSKWHTMHIDRVVQTFAKVIFSGKHFGEINIGYPTEVSVKKIIKIAEKIFSGHYIKLKSFSTDHYVPNLANQNKITRVSALDFDSDIQLYFHADGRKIVKDRVAAITLYRKMVLLMYRISNGKKYYTFPGGGIEKNETKIKALKREIMEEASVRVIPKKLLYEIEWDKDSKQYFYLSDYISGKPQLGDFNEKEAMIDGTQYYEPKWISLANVNKLLIYPLEIRDLLLEDLKSRKWKSLKKLRLELAKSRQTI